MVETGRFSDFTFFTSYSIGLHFMVTIHRSWHNEAWCFCG